MRIVRNFAGVLLLTGALLGTGVAQSGSDSQIQSDLAKALNGSQFSGVRTQVHNGTAMLSGNVAVYAAKEDADRKAHHVHGVKAVENDIQVGGGAARVEDAALAKKLSQKLAYDRVGYGTTAFNSITIGVHDGVVTLGGTVYGPVDKDTAVSDVENTAGVKDVIDNIKVQPTSPMDDQTRVAVFRAIYGAPQLNRYAMDPAKPIRIVVVNGNVTLEGVVASQMDKTIAGLQANHVPGVFKVTNNLQVDGGK